MRESLIGLLASLALSGTAFAGQTAGGQDPAEAKSEKSRREMNPEESKSRADETPPAPPKTSTPSDGSNAASQSGTSQFGRADDRAASSLETHHDLAKNEVTGKIVRADDNTVWIDHMGAVIPLKIEPNTRFESAGITRPKDLKEGQEIRASFTVHNKTTNVADSIWLEGATATTPATTNAHRSGTSSKRPAASPQDKKTNPDTDPNDVK
jgi:hypothetical protein